MSTAGNYAPGDAIAQLDMLPRSKRLRLVRGMDRGNKGAIGVIVRIGLAAASPQAFDLGAALADSERFAVSKRRGGGSDRPRVGTILRPAYGL